MEYSVFLTVKGWMGIAFSGRGIRRVVLPCGEPAQVLEDLRPEADWVQKAECEYQDACQRYAAGERETLDFPVDWSWATPFQRQVLELVRQIPYGQKETYGSVAAKLGNPRGARAVGGALARNQVPLVIPCHRVLSTGKLLGGFTSRNGLADKIALLKMEGILEKPKS